MSQAAFLGGRPLSGRLRPPPPTDPSLRSVEAALAALSRGEFVLVVDDAHRENEGDLIMAAEKVTPEAIAFMVRHTSGLVCVGMEGARLDELRVPPMVPENTTGTAFAISVDARRGVSTGISAADRATTIRKLVDPSTGPHDLVRPGHVFPLRARPGGTLARPGHTEAAVDLARMAGMFPAGALCEVVNEDGTMARPADLERFAREHGLALLSVADLISYRLRVERLVERVSEARLPTAHGEFGAVAYRSELDGTEHLALVKGDLSGGESVLARVHSECLTGEVFHSTRCDCGPQLDLAMARMSQEGRGVLVYLQGHEGRGIGLGHKLRAYQLQERGRDTVEANLELGFPADGRHYGLGAQILSDLGVRSVRLLTNNPAKCRDLLAAGIDIVERIPLVAPLNDDNIGYLRTKRRKLGHLLGAVLDEHVEDGATARGALPAALAGGRS